MHVAPNRERAQHIEMPRRQARQPEEQDPRRQIDDPRLLPQPSTSALNPLRLVRNPNPRPQPPPQLGLPNPVGRHPAVLPASPSPNHLRSMQRVPIEELREMPNRTEPPSPPRGIHLLTRSPQMSGQARQPRLPETPVHRLEQSPNRPLRQPRVAVGLDPRRRSHRIPKEPPRRREVDVRAHPVAPPIPRPKPVRHPLREPSLHPARRHSDDLGREGIVRGIGQERAKRLDEAVGPLSSVVVEHV
jgi:hypothetical protein